MKRLLKVIVADDEAELCDAMCQLIHWNELGFELVGSAQNGLDALRLAERLEPDLLLTDIRMPFISGIDLARQVREMSPMTSIVFLSGYDDFSYAQKAIQYDVIEYLLKPISMAELTAKLVKIRERIEQRYNNLLLCRPNEDAGALELMSLFLNGYADEKWLKEIDLQSLFPKNTDQGIRQFVVFVTKLQKDDTAEIAENWQSLAENVINKYYFSKSVRSGGYIITLLASKSDFNGLNVALDELLQASKRILDVECIIGVSRTFEAVQMCHTAFTEAIDALRFASDQGIHHVMELTEGFGESRFEQFWKSKELEGLICSGDQTHLQNHLQMLFSRAKDCGGVTGEMIPMMIIVTVFQVLQKTVPDNTINMIFEGCKISQQNTYGLLSRERYNRLVSLCLAAQNLLKEQDQQGVSLICTQAMDQINQNYMDDGLSLSTVSKMLHVSPNYLSANMKKYVGDTFINLLIKKRMTIAAELLRTTKMKVLEVSRRCGYTDQHYFSYCFKKYYGISPAQMRSQLKKKGTGE